jgi:hypothetical protein
VGQQRLRRAGAVEADQHRVAVPELIRDLRQRGIEHRDQIRGGVGSSVAGAQHPGQRLVAVVAEREHRVEAERVLERRRCGLLLTVRHHDRGVLIDDQHRPALAVQQRHPGHQRRRQRLTSHLAPLRPRDLASHGPSRRDTVQVRVADRVQHPPAGGVRGHRTEHLGLVGQRGDVADALPAIGEHHRHIHHHPPRIVRRLRRRASREHRRQLRRKRRPIRKIGQQPRPDM